VRSRLLLGALLGLLCAAVAVGIGEAVAVLVRPAASPVIAVGNRVIVLTPESVKRSTINSVGTNDKPLLIFSIYVLLAVFGAVVGQLALRRLAYGLVGIGVFAAFGSYCALTANGSHGGTDTIPTLVGAAVAAGVLVLLVRVIHREDEAATAAHPPLSERRVFLQSGAAVAGIAAIAGFGGRTAQHARFDVAAIRKKIALPKATSAAPTVPRGSSDR
jgi:hypothetical protein